MTGSKFEYKKTAVYDNLVVGDDLTSLLIARRLSLLGKPVVRIAPIESSPDQSFGRGPGFEHILNSPEALELVRWLYKELNLKMPTTDTHDLAAQFYESGQFKDFLGFGNTNFNSAEQLTPYLQPLRISPSLNLEDIRNRLLTELSDVPVARGEITDIQLDATGLVESLCLNASKVIKARRFFFGLEPSTLLSLMPQQGLRPKTRQSIGKAKSWTSLHLQLMHNQILQPQQFMHVLFTPKAEYEPVIGEFLACEGDKQASRWMVLVPQSDIDDMDLLAGAIKHIKKQLKRAYTKVFEQTEAEKVSMLKWSHGKLGTALKEGQQLPEIANLYLTHHCFAQIEGPLAPIQAAELSLGLEPGLLDCPEEKLPLDS